MSLGGTLPPVISPLSPSAASVSPTSERKRARGIVLAGKDMADVATFSICGGTAAAFTRRSPNKSTVNEDVAALVPVSSNHGVLIVADGLGGHAGGEQASRLAVETIQSTILAAAADNGEQLRTAILNGIEAANAAVRELGTGAATTLALVEIQDHTVRPYHVGDSVIVLTGQRGKLKLQTIAHSPIGYAVEAGMIDEQEAIHHEERHMISNVIGSDEMRIEIGPPIEMAARDTLLLASDGLVDNLLPNEIVDRVRSGPLDEAVEKLCNDAHTRMTGEGEADKPSKPDDLTVIAFRFA